MAYIDREQVCENCNNKNYCEKEKCPVYKVSTADVVEVVRCENCKYWDYGRCEGIKNGLIYENTHPYDYCSYGERIE